MSDGEGHGGLPPNDDDLSLPKATVAKMITGALYIGFTSFHCIVASPNLICAELLPKDVVCAKETRDLIIECCVGNEQPMLVDRNRN